MFIEPRQLIAETIDQLETVATFFADEVDERVRAPDKLSVEALAAKEALQTIKILIPRVPALRVMVSCQRSIPRRSGRWPFSPNAAAPSTSSAIVAIAS
jgi:hypothetical protein